MFSIATLALAAATASAALEPSSQWAFETSSICKASRSFGAEGDTVIHFVVMPLTGRYLLSVDLPKPVFVPYGDPFRLIFEPSGREETGRAIGFVPSGDGERTLGSFIDATAFSHEMPGAVRLIVHDKTIAWLAVGDTSPLVAALDRCEREMLRGFGVDLVEQAAVATPAQPLDNPEHWFVPSTYPAAARRAAAQGRVGVRFRVQQDGSVTGCVPVVSSGSAVLDQGTCAIVLARGHYRPARDKDGRAVPSAQIVFTRWVLRNR